MPKPRWKKLFQRSQEHCLISRITCQWFYSSLHFQLSILACSSVAHLNFTFGKRKTSSILWRELLVIIALILSILISSSTLRYEIFWIQYIYICLGQTLNFNCSAILVLMLRHCITMLREIGFASFLPLDQNVYLHRMCGYVVTILGALHTAMHLINFCNSDIQISI